MLLLVKLKAIVMTNFLLNSQTFFFTVNHVTRPHGAKIIYGVSLNNLSYYVSKSPGVNDCEQLDSNPALDTGMIDEICTILSELENDPKSTPSLAWINEQIFAIRGKMRALHFNLVR